MRILLLHQNFPGQFRNLAPALRRQGHDVVGLGARKAPWTKLDLPYLSYGGDPQAALRMAVPEQRLAGQLAHGRRVKAALQELCNRGWQPDVVMVHPFWGDALFLDDVFPEAPLVALLEIDLQDLAMDRFDPEFGCAPGDQGANLALRQWADQLAIRRMQQGLTATQFQRSTYPAWQQPRISVIHEGIDLERCRPDPLAVLQLPDGPRFRRGDPVVSFASRGLEPFRGFATFLRSLPALQRQAPDLQVVVVGQDAPCYGPPPPRPHSSWRALLREELADAVDWSRVHFPGHLPYEQLLRLFQITRAHVYLTYPFVLSWSLLEAMACGAPVVGSATAPVEEVIEHGHNGWLVPFSEPEALAQRVLEVLQLPHAALEAVRITARQSVRERFELVRCTGQQIRLLEGLIQPG